MHPANQFTLGAIDLLVLITVALCVYTDIKSRTIKNSVLLICLVAGTLLSLYSGGLKSLAELAKGFGTGLALLFIPFMLKGMGAGDVKLMAVIGALKGTSFVLLTFLGCALAGGLISLVALIVSGRLNLSKFVPPGLYLTWLKLRAKSSVPKASSEQINPGPVYIPYAAAIGCGVAAAYIYNLYGVISIVN